MPGPQTKARKLRVLLRRPSSAARLVPALRALPAVVAPERDVRRGAPARRSRRARPAEALARRRLRRAGRACVDRASAISQALRHDVRRVRACPPPRLGVQGDSLRRARHRRPSRGRLRQPERLPRRVRAHHGCAARQRDARVVCRVARHTARSDDGDRRRNRAALARVRRSSRPRARDRALTPTAESRHRAGPYGADRADREGARRLLRRSLDDLQDTARLHRLPVPELGVGCPADHSARRNVELREARAGRRPAEGRARRGDCQRLQSARDRDSVSPRH